MRLRFGWPYRFGMRAVYLGGGSRSTKEAASHYGGGLGGKLPYPPSGLAREAGAPPPASEQRRFLRHERIDPPILLLPASLVAPSRRPVGFESASQAVIRSYSKGASNVPNEVAKDRAWPDKTVRYFVLPSVPQAFAALHGVFDGQTTASPKQGLEGVRYDSPKGGFPIAHAVTQHGFNGVPHTQTREIRPATDEDRRGDRVFSTDLASSARLGRYDPDPAAASTSSPRDTPKRRSISRELRSSSTPTSATAAVPMRSRSGW